MAANCGKSLETIRRGMNTPQNQHQLDVVPKDELLPYWLELQVKRGKMTRREADHLFNWYRKGVLPEDSEARQRVDSWLQRILGNVGNAKASVNAGRLLWDFGGLGTYRISRYQGRSYIIFKGNHLLRKTIRGTRYRLHNPQITSMGIGRLGIKHSAKAGSVLTIAVMSSYRVVKYLLDDKATLTPLIGKLTSDVLKISASGLIASVAGAGAAAIMSSAVVGPLLVSIAVGAAAGFLLEKADNHYQLTENLIAGMRQALEEVRNIRTLPCRVRKTAEKTLAETMEAAIDAILEEVRRRGERAMRRLIEPTFYTSPQQLPRL